MMSMNTTEKRFAIAYNWGEGDFVWLEHTRRTWVRGILVGQADRMTEQEAKTVLARLQDGISNQGAHVFDCEPVERRNAAWWAGFRTVIPADFKGTSTPEMRDRARAAAAESVLAAGFPA